jgi:hypothetical protein
VFICIRAFSTLAIVGALSYPVPTKAWALRRVAQVLAVGVYERLCAPVAVSALDVPRSPREASPQWLTAGLCPEETGARVLSVTGSRRHDARLRGLGAAVS